MGVRCFRKAAPGSGEDKFLPLLGGGSGKEEYPSRDDWRCANKKTRPSGYGGFAKKVSDWEERGKFGKEEDQDIFWGPRPSHLKAKRLLSGEDCVVKPLQASRYGFNFPASSGQPAVKTLFCECFPELVWPGSLRYAVVFNRSSPTCSIFNVHYSTICSRFVKR